MDNVSFQNGFICGMATRGLATSHDVYKPTAWNDNGVYDFFYLDFHRVPEPFSCGQFNESITVKGDAVLTVTDVKQAYTDNPYVPQQSSVSMTNGTLTDTTMNDDVLRLEVSS